MMPGASVTIALAGLAGRANLDDTGLFLRNGDSRVETIDLADASRRWKVYIRRSTNSRAGQNPENGGCI
jgi:hypothetical protein